MTAEELAQWLHDELEGNIRNIGKDRWLLTARRLIQTHGLYDHQKPKVSEVQELKNVKCKKCKGTGKYLLIEGLLEPCRFCNATGYRSVQE